jgi:hypothetical protein
MFYHNMSWLRPDAATGNRRLQMKSRVGPDLSKIQANEMVELVLHSVKSMCFSAGRLVADGEQAAGSR